MNLILRAALLTAVTVVSVPAVAAGQEVPADSLLRRIDLLERRVSDLERRVVELEALIRVEPAPDRPVAKSGNWRDLQNWRRLRIGMSMDQVRELLGEPARVDANFALTTWYWDGAQVQFETRSGTLSSWSEPGR